VNFKYTTGTGGSDTTPPVVSVTSPSAGQTVSGTLTITATATDNVGVAGVTFRVDGNAVGAEDTTAPYSATLDTATLTNGSHTITAVARDTSNLTTTSQGVTVTVSNASPAPTKVMPLGDSMTYGFVGTNSPHNEDGGYRLYLWQSLSPTKNLNFVGSLQSGLPTMDRDHEGHTGYTITAISGGVNTWIASAQPAVILLLIGVNDLYTDTPATALSRLSSLVDQILTTAPSSRLIVSSLIGIRQNSSEPVTQQAINSYNAGIPNIVNSRAAAGKNISFVDTYTIAALDTSSNSADYGPDGLHPSPQGYSKMANAWSSVLSPLLPSK
jgi:lysophospholipase L1-like esterase